MSTADRFFWIIFVPLMTVWGCVIVVQAIQSTREHRRRVRILDRQCNLLEAQLGQFERDQEHQS